MEKTDSYGLLQARRAWLTKDDVLNTMPAAKFAPAMKMRGRRECRNGRASLIERGIS